MQGSSEQSRRFVHRTPEIFRSEVLCTQGGQPNELVHSSSENDTHVGHLGIFVSAGVARLEHRAMLESLDELEALAPGLYEMKIINPTGDPDCRKPKYDVTFEERRVEDIRFDYLGEAFETVRRISEFNESLYRGLVSPWVQALATPWTATALKLA